MVTMDTSNLIKSLVVLMVVVSAQGRYSALDELKRKLLNLWKQQKRNMNTKRNSLSPSLTEKNKIDAILDKIEPMVASLGECKDKASWCTTYKSYCSSNEQVKTTCPSTCGLCSTTECVDTHPNCNDGVQFGYCQGSEREKDFMKKYCSKSCGYCNKVTPCTDQQGEAYCSQIKNLAYCQYEAYEERFKQYCRKSCNFCEECGIAPARSKNSSATIVGGVDATKGYYPWQVAIYYKDEFLCGGTLISAWEIVTAAHCFNKADKTPSNYIIVLGEHQRAIQEGTEQTVIAEKIIVHEEYDPSADHHDIALVKMKERAQFSDYIAKLCMASRDAVLPVGTKCYITGWGKLYSSGKAVESLQQVKVPIADLNVCKTRNMFNSHVVTNKMICAGYEGSSFASACHGDSGGPLQCEFNGKWYLYGVVSWGSPLCNGLDRFTVFSKVSYYLKWIENLRTV